MTLAKAFRVFGKQRYIQGAVDAAEVVWTRGLLRRIGVCHGISGNTYVHLTMYRLFKYIEEKMQVESELTSDDYLHRAMMFGEFLAKNYRRHIKDGYMHGGESPHSLFEGTLWYPPLLREQISLCFVNVFFLFFFYYAHAQVLVEPCTSVTISRIANKLAFLPWNRLLNKAHTQDIIQHFRFHVVWILSPFRDKVAGFPISSLWSSIHKCDTV